MTDVEAWIKKCEALKLQLYFDTKGNPTIGWGRNLRKGISIDEAELMFQNDLKETISELETCSWYHTLPSGVKTALINMNFNLGIGELLKFHEMISALIAENWTLAAQSALDSVWAKQVGDRAKDIAVLIREGN